MLDAFVGPINVTAEYVDRISKGDIPEKITDEYKGKFNEIKTGFNQCIDAINALVSEAGVLAAAAAAGELDTRGNENEYQGDYRQIVQGMNETMDAVAKPLKDIGDTLDRVADEVRKLAERSNQAAGSMQLVSFKLADETYGIEITRIREIILVGDITQIPETPHYIKGLINLRSSVIPVIDLRARFGLADGVLQCRNGRTL